MAGKQISRLKDGAAIAARLARFLRGDRKR